MMQAKDYHIFNALLKRVEDGETALVFHNTTVKEARYLLPLLRLSISANFFHDRIDSALELAYWLQKIIDADEEMREHWRF